MEQVRVLSYDARMRGEWKSLVAAARSARRRAHAPYSGFRVGAALLDADGAVFRGANLENAAYPLGICAERIALAQWRIDRGGRLRGIVIFTDTEAPTPPCGWCRDAFLRFAPEAEICLATPRKLLGPWKARDFVPAIADSAP
jgi:cytidine deaminase